jgi:hypothetical protein
MCIACLLSSAALLRAQVPATVEKWHPTDLTFASTTVYSNPFQNVSISATFTGPGGITLTVPGFYAGSQTWKVRFSPTAEGAWSYTTSSADPNLINQTGTITCVTNTNPALHGALKVDSSHPHCFIYEDGTPCFLMSFEADWLGLMDFGDTNVTKAKSLINIYSSHGFNGVMMQVYAYDTTWAPASTCSVEFSNACFAPPAEFPGLGSNTSPDWSHMNTDFFDNYDRVIDYLFQEGITAHVMFKVYNKDVNWPPEGSADENLYFTYVTARYQAYPNIVWDFTKEGKREPNNTYVTNSLLTIKGSDAYHRLTTVDDDLSYYSAFPNTCDFQSIQADGTPLYSTLIADQNAKNWPVFEAETDAYQVGNDGTTPDPGHGQSMTTVLTDTCECLMAGSPVNYYYDYHAWDVVRYNETPDGLSAYQNLVNFFKGTAWESLAPNDSLINSAGVGRHCLALPGSEYVVYLSAAGSVTLMITGAPAGKSLTASWWDVVTGAQQALANTGNGSNTFTNPWSDPALFLAAKRGVVNFPPLIEVEPASLALVTGLTAQFDVVAGGPGTLSYQWQAAATGVDVFTNLFDTGNISGSATATLTITDVTLANAAGYRVIVTNAYGSVTSSVATLTLVAAQNFTTTVCEPSSENWNSAVWQTNGGPLVGPVAGNTYEALYNGYALGNSALNTRVRAPNQGGMNTFPGASLTLDTNTELRTKASGTLLNFPGTNGSPGLILNGGNISEGDAGNYLYYGVIEVAAQSYLAGGNNTGAGGGATTDRSVNIEGQLTGSGTLVIMEGTNDVPQQISGTTNTFSGQWIVKAGWLLGAGANSLGTNSITIDPNWVVPEPPWDPSTVAVRGPAWLEVNYNLNSAGTLILTNGGQFKLHQDCCFAAVNIEGAALAPGTHYYAALAAQYPANFPAGGSGSITVRPYNASASPPVTLQIQRSGTNVQLTWSQGLLLQATNVPGLWTTNNSATSPLTTTPTGQKFYRVRVQ